MHTPESSLAGGGASDGVIVDRKRLQLITESLGSFRGFTFVAMGAMFVLSDMEKIYGVFWPWLGWLLWIADVVAAALLVRIPRYYERRFGRVEPRSPSHRSLVIFVLILILLAAFGGGLDRLLAGVVRLVHIAIADPSQQIQLLSFAVWISELGGRVWRGRLSDGFGDYLFPCCGTFACALVAFYPLRHPEVTEMLWWRTLNVSSFGLSLMAIGLYDHFTLVRLMPKKVTEDEIE